jgi:hypothetical protein
MQGTEGSPLRIFFRGMDVIKPIITGSFMDFQHPNNWDAQYWIDQCREWSAEQWAALVDDMHLIGMDTVIILGCALWGRPLYPADRRKVGIQLPMGCADPLEAVLGAADRHGMKVYPGLGFFGRCSLSANPDLSPEHDTWLCNMASDILEKYSHHPSLQGFYVSAEMVPAKGGGIFKEEDCLKTAQFVRRLREHVGDVQLLASPGNLKLPRQEQLDTLAKQLESLDLDIIAYQDHAGFMKVYPDMDFRVAAQGFELIRPLHEKLGIQFWVNCECFDFEKRPDGRNVCIPCEFSRLREQLLAAAVSAEKIITYQYQGIMNRKTPLVNIGAEGTQQLYDDYVNFIRGI